MKITLVISSLSSGGAERVFSEIANYLVGKGHIVNVVTLSHPSSAPFYPLEPRIILNQSNLLSDKKSNYFVRLKEIIYRVYKLRKTILSGRPDVILSFMDIMNITTLLAMKGTHIPIIVSERIDPNFHIIPKLYSWLRSKLYPESYRIVVQTQNALQYFFGSAKEKCQIIPNFNRIKYLNDKKIEIKPSLIISVGRLDKQKDHKTLIMAMPAVLEQYPNVKLKIYGDGPLKNELQNLVGILKLTNSIEFAGVKKEIAQYLEEADLFVFPSLYEGFPNALLEAMAVGLPCIASNCSGNVDIISDNVDGQLFQIGDSKGLSNQIIELLRDPEVRARYSKTAQKKAFSYDPEVIFTEWESLFLGACSNHS